MKKRMPCLVDANGMQHQGIVLNVSRGGLYVQTRAEVEVGTVVGLELAAPPRAEAIPLRGRVVWRRVLARRTFGVNEDGMGLCLQDAPEAYDGLVDDLLHGQEVAGTPEDPRFKVRMRLEGSPRSRTLLISSPSEEEARSRALREAGDGWTVLELKSASTAQG